MVGSFLNVLIARLPYEKSIVWPGSRCFSCYRPIRLTDNLPIVGYLRLRGFRLLGNFLRFLLGGDLLRPGVLGQSDAGHDAAPVRAGVSPWLLYCCAIRGAMLR